MQQVEVLKYHIQEHLLQTKNKHQIMELFDAHFVHFGQTLFQSATGGGANQCLGYGAWLTAQVRMCRVHSRFSHV